MSVCGPQPHINTDLRPPLELMINQPIKAEILTLFNPEKELKREKEREWENGRWGEGASIFHLYSPADMASQRNLSLDLQNSQLSLSSAVNLAVILHWRTFCSFIWGIFHLMIFMREADWQKRCMCGKPQKSNHLINQLSELRSAWLTRTHLNLP